MKHLGRLLLLGALILPGLGCDSGSPSDNETNPEFKVPKVPPGRSGGGAPVTKDSGNN